MKIQALIFVVLLAFAYAESAIEVLPGKPIVNAKYDEHHEHREHHEHHKHPDHKKCKIKGFKSAEEILEKDRCLLRVFEQRGEEGWCPKEFEKIGNYCYKKCPKGFKTVGKICIEECKKGLIDQGEYCKKPETYERKCYPCDKKEKCEEDSETGKCEKFGDKHCVACKPGYHPVGCCLCVPDCKKCPKEYKKKIIKREHTKLFCKDHLKLFRRKCYPKCKRGFHGKGPLCFPKCPKGLIKCGWFCVKPKCFLCNGHTDKVLKEVGHLLLFLEGHHNEFKLNLKDIIKHAEKKCKDLSPKKKKLCEAKIFKLVKLLPGKHRGKWSKMEVCKVKYHHHKKPHVA